MESMIITALETVLSLVSGTSVASGTIGNVIRLLQQVIPLAQQEYQTILPYVQNIIASLQANQQTTAQQAVELSKLDAQADAVFDAAAAKAEADDA